MKSAIAAALALMAFFAAEHVSAQVVLERGNGADPVTLDPQRAATAAEANILRDLYEGLTTYDAAGRLIPGMASGWTVSDDGLVYVFTLRRASWSNRTMVTAEDFVDALQRLVDPNTAAPEAHLFSAIAGAEAIAAGRAGVETLGVRADDPFTLVIELSRPEPLLPYLLARPAAMPIHRNFRNVPDMPIASRPFNGPYRFDRFEPGIGLWLTKNQSYYAADTVAFDTVGYRGYDRLRALAAFRAGELLISNDLPLFGIAEIADEFGPALHATAYAGTFFLAANVGGVLADPALRLAVALSIDRIALADDVWLGVMIPTLSLLPPGLAALAGEATAALGPNELDRRRADARSLLAAAGHNGDNPLRLTLAISDEGLERQTADAIAADLDAVGIELAVVERTAAEHQSHLTADRDFDLAVVGWFGDVGHAAEFLALFAPGGLDVTGYDDTAFQSLVAEAAISADVTVRAALYAAANRRLMQALPGIPLLHYESFNLVAPELDGWIDNVIDVHLSRWLRPTAAED